MRDYSKITKPTPERYCAYCGKKMERKRFPNGKPESINLFLKRKYCNRDCMKRSFVEKSGELQGWGEAHHSARKIAYLIEGREKKCEICGNTKNIDVHHKDGNHHNNAPENLMLVCRSCHMKLHRPQTKCVICGRPAKGHGYCEMHLIRFRKYGNPLYYQGRIVAPTFTERKMFVETEAPKENGTQLTLF